MKLRKLLKIHDQYSSSESLASNLGDGYLLKHNEIYRRIRRHVLEAGFRFERDRFFDYDSLALTQLPKILEHQTIPYCDNVKPLREIEKRAPGIFDSNEIPPLRANYVLHESAHGLAHLSKKQFFKAELKKTKIDRERSLVLQVFLEESFANACESFLSLDASNEVHHEFLFKNTYIIEDLPTRERMNEATDLVGPEAIFRLVMLSFLHANFLKTRISAAEMKRVVLISCGELPSKGMAILTAVFKAGFDLDPEFTIRTHSFCLRLMGIRTPMAKFFDFDFLKVIETEAPYRLWMEDLSRMACSG